MTASGKRNFSDRFSDVDWNSSQVCPDPFRPSSFLQSCLSAKPRFSELGCSEAAIGDLTLPARSGQLAASPIEIVRGPKVEFSQSLECPF